jgi:hypothetical protein
LRLLETPQGPTPLWSVPAANLPLASAHPDRAVKIAETGAVLVSTLVGGNWTWIAGAGALSRAEMPGLEFSTAGGSTSFTISAGRCADDTGSVLMVLAANHVTTAAPFVAGSGVGGLDTGAMPVSDGKWFHVFLIAKADGTTDILFSLSATAPTMPTGFIYKRRIFSGAAYLSSNVWMKVWQRGDDVLYDASVLSVGAVIFTQDVRTAAVLAVPPQISVDALVNLMIHHPSGACYVRLDNPSVSDQSLANGNHHLMQPSVGAYASTQVRVRTNIAQQITARVTGGHATLWINVLGFSDRRGRDG